MTVKVDPFVWGAGGQIVAAGHGRSVPSESGVLPEFFGMHNLGLTYWTHFNTANGWAGQHANFAGFRIWDMWDVSNQYTASGTSWRNIHTGINTYNWSMFDGLLTNLQNRGITPANTIYTFGYTPQWANSAGNSSLPPDNLLRWDEFVAAIVTRAAGRIKNWGIWNEPNSTNFWQGTMAQLKTLAARAYPIIKNIDPTAIVLSPEMQGNPHGQMAQFWDAAPAGPAHDVIGIHLYGTPAGIGNNGPTETIWYVDNMKAAMAARGINQPMWDTEFGNPLDGGTMLDNTTAAYVAKKLALNASMGIKRSFWYAWDAPTGRMWSDNPNATNGVHLIWNEVRSWLLGKTVGVHALSGSRYTIPLTGPSGYSGVIAWTENTTGTLTVTAGQYKRTRTTGSVQTTVASGTTSIALSDTPILIDNVS